MRVGFECPAGRPDEPKGVMTPQEVHKKEFHQLLGFLFLEILVGINAGVTFSLVESRYKAALWTGACFFVLGLVLVYWSYKHHRKLLFAFALLHTFAMSFPIWITRAVTQNDLPLESVLGFPGPLIHKVASAIFWILVVLTAWEIIKIFRKQVRASGMLDM